MLLGAFHVNGEAVVPGEIINLFNNRLFTLTRFE